MDYTLATIDRESQDPVAFAEWLADEGFIESGDQACHRCGRGMGFGESKHYHRDEVAVRCTISAAVPIILFEAAAFSSPVHSASNSRCSC